VTYDYLVTNTGNVTLNGISLSDDNDNDNMVCEATTLAVGAHMHCTATHTFSRPNWMRTARDGGQRGAVQRGDSHLG